MASVRFPGRSVQRIHRRMTLKTAREITIQKHRSQRSYVIPFDRFERTLYDETVIGYVVCPDCKQKMQVLNKGGEAGLPLRDYIVDHESVDFRDLCEGSGKIFKNHCPSTD